MTVYIVLGVEPYYGTTVSVLGVYRDRSTADEVYYDYFWRGYKELEVVEEYMD